MKVYSDIDVYTSAIERLEYTFNNFERVCLSFSNGKDSGVMLNLAIEVARRLDKLPLNVMYIDMEAQYKHAIDFTYRTFNRDEVNGYWICLPINLRNSVSQIQTHWTPWDVDKKDAWVREMPQHKSVISDANYFDFFTENMEFEDFVPKFGKWFSQGKKTAILVGIRSNESLNRFRTIASRTKTTIDGKQWTTKIFPKEDNDIYNVYPIYDWTTEDIWVANGKFKWDYNRIYDMYHLAGVPLSKQRLCQPYGDDQRQGLYLFKALESETWAKVVNRVEGANFGNRYTETNKTTLGNYKVNLPPNHTYESYSKFLLDTMPPYLSAHYKERIDKFLSWWEKEGECNIPDKADAREEASRKVPSWRRICKVLLKNDYWCKGLSFTQTKRGMEKQIELITKYQNLL